MPDWGGELRRRLASLRLSPTREAEIVEELSQHLDDRYSELIAGGASPAEARRGALDDFRSGNRLAAYLAPLRQSRAPEEITIAAPRAGMLSDFWLDLRYATRTFWKRPAFAAATALTLALGIGAATAIFSVLYGVVLKPLPFADQDRLVTIRHHAPHGAGRNHGPATYLTYRENQKTFEAIGAWDNAEVSVAGAGVPERLAALRVSSSTLPLLRVQPTAGRFFTDDDDAPGAQSPRPHPASAAPASGESRSPVASAPPSSSTTSSSTAPPPPSCSRRCSSPPSEPRPAPSPPSRRSP